MTQSGKMTREETAEYLIDMMDQMAKLARQAGELHVAIHLEAIIAAQHAIAKDRSAD